MNCGMVTMVVDLGIIMEIIYVIEGQCLYLINRKVIDS